MNRISYSSHMKSNEERRNRQISAHRRQILDLDDWTDLHDPFASSGNSGRNADGFIEIIGVNHEEAAELLASFCKRAVGDEALALANADAGGGGDGLQGRGGQKLTLGVEVVGQRGGLHVARLPGGIVEKLLVLVNQKQVLHIGSSTGESNGKGPDRHRSKRKIYN